MAKIILTVDGAQLSELLLAKGRVTIGRRPHNDLVIDHVAISGEHVAIIASKNDWFLKDLNSTNGTLVNGQPVKRHRLQDKDVIELPPYKIKFVAGANLDREVASQQHAAIRVMTGPSTGREIALVKSVTTIGRPGVQVAVVTHRKEGYFIAHVEGSSFPLVNGDSIGANPQLLKSDDVIDLSGTQMVFRWGAG